MHAESAGQPGRPPLAAEPGEEVRLERIVRRLETLAQPERLLIHLANDRAGAENRPLALGGRAKPIGALDDRQRGDQLVNLVTEPAYQPHGRLLTFNRRAA